MTNLYSTILSPAQVLQALEQPDVVAIDCRFRLSDPASTWGETQYQASHLPGAYYLHLDRDLSSPIQEHGGRHPLPDPAIFARKLETCGIEWGKTWVIAYDDARFAFASRLLWLLRYYGHEKVSLLDGGWPAWQQENLLVTDVIPPEKQGHFIPQIQSDWIVSRDELLSQQNQAGVVVIDSRERDRYLGKIEPIDPVAGHIPGAENSPWQQVTTETGQFQAIAHQKELWKPYENQTEIILYCGSGVTACVNWISLTEASFPPPKLYPGGWSDWCTYLN